MWNFFGYEIPLATVIKSQQKSKLFGYTDYGKYVVRPTNVSLDWNFSMIFHLFIKISAHIGSFSSILYRVPLFIKSIFISGAF